MKSITVSIEEEQIEYLDELSQDDGPYDNRSEAIRDTIDQYPEIEQLKTETERLQREKQQILDQREEHAKLVEFAEQEKSLQEWRIEANLIERAKWWILGKKK